MQIMSHGLYLQICDYSLYYCWHKVKLEIDISLFLINGNNNRTKNNLTFVGYVAWNNATDAN